MSEIKRPLPKPTPETQHFWDGCKAGELRLQKCGECDLVYYPPRPFCPSCSTRNVGVVVATGKARLVSYVINHRPHPAWSEPHSIAIVELEEGPRMATNIINCPQTPEALQIDMPVEVIFEQASDDITLPLFQPVGEI
ncbi:MAG: OB-fold domain-containing protein [Pseudomonadota bacterium]